MLSFWMVGLTLAMSHCNGLDMMEEVVRPDTLLPFRITTEEFKKEVIATTKANRKVKFDCKFFLVHNGKTVFLENQAPSLEMAAKDRKGKGGKKQKAKKTVNKPMTQIDASKVPVIKEPIQIKPRLSKVSCAIHSIGTKIRAHADNVEIISSSTSNPRTIFTLDISTNPDVIRNASIRTVKLVSGKEMFEQLEIKSKIDKLNNLTPEEKASMNKFLQSSVFNFAKHENEALLMKSKKTFIQFNSKTDQLGLNARLLTAIQVQANRTDFQLTEAEKIEDINKLFDDLSENCQNSTTGFEGTDPSEISCNPCDKYRRIDGICNNLENKEFGAAGIAMRRLLHNAYQDGFSIPRGGFFPDLPSPRKISVELHHSSSSISSNPFSPPDTPLTSKGFNHMAMQFGQFLDHDIALSAQQGNLYAKDQFLMSCCGCFKIICNSTEPSAYSRHIAGKIFFWSKTLEARCCQDCQGKVFSAGTLMDTEILDDKCSTSVSTKCVFVGQENRAIAEMSYTYPNCCSDDTGLHPIGTTIQVPETCSKRTCDREDGQIHSAWITKQVVSGCNCCPLPPICSEPKVTCSAEEGSLVEDGGVLVVHPGYPDKPKHLKCCEGKFLEENLSFGK